MSALYVYGLSTEAPAGDLGTGISGEPVTVLPAGALVALVSSAPRGPVNQTRRNMIAHTSVLECAMAKANVLPLRFGTIAPNPEELHRCARDNETTLRSALSEIAGCVELGLKASWRQGIIFPEIVAADPELAHLRDRLRTRPASETYYERVELGRRVEGALDRVRCSEAAAILAELTPLAEREAKLRASEDEIVFNRAFLVRRDTEAAFDSRVQALAGRHASRLEFRYVGPVPPYNFVRLQVGWLGAA